MCNWPYATYQQDYINKLLKSHSMPFTNGFFIIYELHVFWKSKVSEHLMHKSVFINKKENLASQVKINSHFM